MPLVVSCLEPQKRGAGGSGTCVLRAVHAPCYHGHRFSSLVQCISSYYAWLCLHGLAVTCCI